MAGAGRAGKALPAHDAGPRLGAGYIAGALCLGWGLHAVWIRHEVAGLAVLGNDYLTYVKVLPVQDFAYWHRAPLLWSLPWTAVSVPLSQSAWWRSWLPFPSALGEWGLRLSLTLLSLYAALQILPLDWTPRNLAWPSNRVQTLCAAGCCALALFGPVTGPWVMRHAAWWLPGLCLAALGTVWIGQIAYLPYFADVYRQELAPGPGPFLTALGALILAGTRLVLAYAQSRVQRTGATTCNSEP